MGYPVQKGSVQVPMTFLMVSSADHKTGVPGLAGSLTVEISKNGAAFASPAGAVEDIGFGWYGIVPNLADFNTFGPIILNASGPGVDPTDDRFLCGAYNPYDAAYLGLSSLQTVAAIAGPGATACTIHLQDTNGAAVANAQVWLTSDQGGSSIVAGVSMTNSLGNVIFLLTVGTTYYLWTRKDGESSLSGVPYIAEP